MDKISPKKSAWFLIACLFAYFVLSLIVSAIFNNFTPKGTTYTEYFSNKIWFPIVSYGIFPLCFIICYGVFSFTNRDFFTLSLKNEKFNVKYLPIAIGLSLCVIFGLSQANSYFLQLLNKLFGYIAPQTKLPEFSVFGFIICFIFICVLPPICEEMMFRKIILDSLSGFNVVFIVLFNGFLFCIFHMSPAQTPYQFIFGCLFALVAIYTKNILFTIIMHSLNNTIVLIMYYTNFSLGFMAIPVMIIGIIGLVLGVIYIIKKLKQREFAFDGEKKDLLLYIVPIISCVAIWIGSFYA